MHTFYYSVKIYVDSNGTTQSLFATHIDSFLFIEDVFRRPSDQILIQHFRSWSNAAATHIRSFHPSSSHPRLQFLLLYLSTRTIIKIFKRLLKQFNLNSLRRLLKKCKKFNIEINTHVHILANMFSIGKTILSPLFGVMLGI